MRPNSHRAKVEEEAADLAAEKIESRNGGNGSGTSSGSNSFKDEKDGISKT